MIQEIYLQQDLCQKLVEKGMEIVCSPEPNYTDGILDKPLLKCTQAQAVRWLLEECHLFIEVVLRWDDADKPLYLSRIIDIDIQKEYNDFPDNVSINPEQAAEAAIKYCVNNLIQTEL